MSNDKNIANTLSVKGTEITVLITPNQEDYISLTDIARYKNSDSPADVVKNWMRMRSTIEYLGLWEKLNNLNFKLVEFDQFKIESGSNAFVLSPQKWIKLTNAIGIISKSGRYNGGTFAHKDIAFEFASWVSPEFKLYIIKDYQRLKEDENYRLSLDWSVKRILTKANYRIHTDAIKGNLISTNLPTKTQGFIYADEADVLNISLFGKTAKEWRTENPEKKGNIRDYATIEQLLVLTNLENINATLLNQSVPQSERMVELRKIAIHQLHQLSNSRSIKSLKDLDAQMKISGNTKKATKK